jgi:CubicO group peptidase (beta-lactamase class C family)
MPRLLVGCLLSFACVLAVAQTTNSLPNDNLPPAISCPKAHLCPALLHAFGAVVPQQMKNFDVPGAAIALIEDGQVIYAKGFGVRNIETGEPFTLDTVYRIGSTTKSYTSMLAAMGVAFIRWVDT